MEAWQAWKWTNTFTPRSVLQEPGRIVLIDNIRCINEGLNLDDLRFHDLVLITGDGACLPADVKEFESWGVPHDLYCVNRSMLFFERQIDHWCAIDAEEARWFAQNVTKKVCPDKLIHRHTIGQGEKMFDIWWERVYDFEHEYQRRVWAGNTGYFALLSAICMGYKKIVLAGIPLNTKQHWYEPEGTPGPEWKDLCYQQWEDHGAKLNGNNIVRSMSGKTSDIYGLATKDWANVSD